MPDHSFDHVNRFGPSRSAVMATRGMVVTSQPLAALVGVDVLRGGGNAVDAAVAAAAMLNVIEPMSTGIGGDVFALVYEASTNRLAGLNASGRSPAAATLERVTRRLSGAGVIPPHSPLAITVPGTVDGWAAAAERWGRLTLADVLAPAIRVADEGFAVAPQTALTWRETEGLLAQSPDSARTWLVDDGRAPRAGERFRVPGLARTLSQVAEGGRDAFYRGAIADQIVRACEAAGGLLAREDLEAHTSNWVEPLSVSYRGVEVFELPPNGQGILVLEALRMLAGDDIASYGHNSADAIHLQVEAMKIAFEDARRYVTDPGSMSVDPDDLISREYAERQRARISNSAAVPRAARPSGSDTVYVCAADEEGNVVSFINSIFMPWGSGLTVGDTGIVLQNRGCAFSLEPDHANVLAPRKRTRHTILPAMLLENGRPLAAFGCVGGDIQPQGQLQFLCNLLDFGMNVQDALDAPRWRSDDAPYGLALEPGIAAETRAELERRGHALTGGGFFGGGQALLVDPDHRTLHGGSDSRRDGCAIGY